MTDAYTHTGDTPITVVCRRRPFGCPTGSVTVPGEDGRIADRTLLEGWRHDPVDGWTCPWCQP